MIRLSTLDENEMKYICTVIPLNDKKKYFKLNPFDLGRVRPGFRASSLRDNEEAGALLLRASKRRTAYSFIERIVSKWIDQVQQDITRITSKGETIEAAWTKILPFSFFAGEIGIFFKLIGEEKSDDYLSMASASIKVFKETFDSLERRTSESSQQEKELKGLKSEIDRLNSKLEECENILSENAAAIKALEDENAGFKALEFDFRTMDSEISELKNKTVENCALIKALENELAQSEFEKAELENRLIEEQEMRKIPEYREPEDLPKPMKPKDIDEFNDYLGFNLENIGIQQNSGYYSLLTNYLCRILFSGNPILINRDSSMALMRCVGNALVGSPNIATLIYSEGISEQSIDEFLSLKNRILCLDNFIGNFNETLLATACDRHKDKIIFLTYAYGKTLYYIPEEFMKYCHCLNVRRIEALKNARELTEIPTELEEVEAPAETYASESKKLASLRVMLKEALDEIGMGSALSIHKCALVSNEEMLCQLLAFDILPYCCDSLDISPFLESERLNEYTGQNGKCHHSGLLRRWFA